MKQEEISVVNTIIDIIENHPSFGKENIKNYLKRYKIIIGTDEFENASERKKKASKKTEKENKPKQQKESKRFQKRTHGGITFEVEVINGRDYFNGKEIHCDNSGFYHPYAKMKDIMKWTKEHLKKNSYATKTKIGRD